ncbi:LuxR C-terminal-related transcriptional regulator [Streptomyces lanatus]|uniref:helix-turn-helix transcriptional regulator n=2 Tax=Streptomyces lanatus TaxID=66900 RepID=UPI0019CDCF23|nr:hypothetical protein GCM10018780_89030 [Streptomyces lanatus]
MVVGLAEWSADAPGSPIRSSVSELTDPASIRNFDSPPAVAVPKQSEGPCGDDSGGGEGAGAREDDGAGQALAVWAGVPERFISRPRNEASWTRKRIGGAWGGSRSATLHHRRRTVCRAERPARSEREVLALMTEGRTDNEIARELYVTEAAVNKHVSNMLQKLDLPTDGEGHRRVLAVLTYLLA